MRTTLNVLPILFLPYIAFGQSASTGTFSGSVLDQNGAPLAGALVAFQRVPKLAGYPAAHPGRTSLAPGEVIYSTAATTNRRGQYSATGLPAGTYNYCVLLAGYLDPCRWAYGPRAVIQAGVTAPLPVITLKKGVIVSVTLLDPSKLVGQYNLIAPGFAVGVFSQSGSYYGAGLSAQSSGRFLFQVTVPSDQPVHLWLHSSKYTLTDQSGTAIAAQGLRQALSQGAAQGAAQNLTFAITGLR